MEISSQSPALQPLDPAGAVKSASDSGGPAAPRVPAQDVQRDVTSLALGSALSGDDTRVSRVQALQGQIASGTYQIDTQAVASKLLDTLAEGE